MTRAVIFDFDGLVIDSERVMVDALVEVLGSVGATVTLDEITHLFGSTDDDDEWERIITSRCDLSLDEVVARMTAIVRPAVDALPLLPGVQETIDAARRNDWKVGLGTGHDRALLGPRLERLGLEFDAVVTADEVARGKPAPDVFLEVARRLGVDPADCIVLEDSPNGCAAGLAAGMRVIACPSSVTAAATFPDGVERVRSLVQVTL